MGNFSYLCIGCSTGIRDYEEALLRHLRHGQIVGEAEGLYDGYGRIRGVGGFRHDDDRGCDPVHSHVEMVRSQFDLPDSGSQSGIQAWHKACFEQASLVISERDPRQGEGRPRPQFSPYR